MGKTGMRGGGGTCLQIGEGDITEGYTYTARGKLT